MKEKYEVLQGFYDLRDYKLSNNDFKKLYKIQQFLFQQEKNKEYLKAKQPQQWEKLKQLSAEYQQCLLGVD